MYGHLYNLRVSKMDSKISQRQRIIRMRGRTTSLACASHAIETCRTLLIRKYTCKNFRHPSRIVRFSDRVLTGRAVSLQSGRRSPEGIRRCDIGPGPGVWKWMGGWRSQLPHYGTRPCREKHGIRSPCRNRSGVTIVIRPELTKHPFWIAVGTPITERPPHRTVRAVFPHTAPTLGVWASTNEMPLLVRIGRHTENK
jgi:hypothetical protein